VTQIDTQPYAAAIKTLLDDIDIRVGGAVAPRSADGRIVAPCVVLYMNVVTRVGDGVGCAGDDASVRFQLTSVDLTDEGAMAQDARARAVLHNGSLLVDDRFTCRMVWAGSQPVLRDEDVTPPCFYVTSNYTLMSMSDPSGS